MPSGKDISSQPIGFNSLLVHKNTLFDVIAIVKLLLSLVFTISQFCSEPILSGRKT